MPRSCSICQHPERRAAIDQALRAGEPLRTIAARYTTSVATLSRHAAHAGTESTSSPAPLQAVPQPRDVPEQTGDVAEQRREVTEQTPDVPVPDRGPAPAHAVPAASAPVRCPLCHQRERLEQPGCRGDFRCARCGYVFHTTLKGANDA